MITGCGDLGQIILHLFPVVNVCGGKRRKSYDSIHRRPDIVGHIIEKCCLRPVGVLRSRKRILQIEILPFQLFLHLLFIIYINE